MIYLNNRLVPDSKAVVSVFDHGFLYGDGIYETLRAYDGVVFKIEEHIERLFNSAALIRLDISKTPETIIRAVNKTGKANRLSDAYIRITVSRGKGPIGLDPALCPKPTFVIIANPFHGYPAAYYKRGVNVAIVNTRRNFNKSIDPAIKSLNFLNNILAKIEAKERGAYEAIMLNYSGYITEGTISNIFFVKNRTLYTPEVSVGILNGITRMAIIGIAKELGIKVREGKFRPAHIYGAEEVFISNTTMEVMPVAKADDIKIGSGPGKITKAIHQEYKRKVAEYVKQQYKA
ncbi:MAG: branched-chain-amino-acid transaminase [Thermodesulfovibrionia bacterium]|nr:branched-chain-amino-acid transaminase [Thermodesulfovibrionia bacterium]